MLGPVYTSYAWLRALLLEAGVLVSFSEHGARENPPACLAGAVGRWIESFWGRFKTENQSLLLEAGSLVELERRVYDQMAYYNTRRRHSGLDYQTPEDYLKRQGMPLRALSEELALEVGRNSGCISRPTGGGTCSGRLR